MTGPMRLQRHSRIFRCKLTGKRYVHDDLDLTSICLRQIDVRNIANVGFNIEMIPTLYYAIPSANSERTRMVLFLKKVEYTPRLLNLNKLDQKQPDFLRLNPYGKVPVLEDDGKIIFESCIINDYLDQRFPSPPLWPTDPYLRARGQMMAHYSLEYLQEHYWPLRVEMGKTPAERNISTVDAMRRILEERLAYLETALGDKPYFLGTFGMTDINLWPRLSRLGEFGAISPAKSPMLTGWIDRMGAQPAVQHLKGKPASMSSGADPTSKGPQPSR